jgi:exoribonuclease R
MEKAGVDIRKNPMEAIREAAAAEAEHFSMPDDWRQGRPRHKGTTIDEEGTRLREDALDVTTDEAGKPSLDVHICDIGSFVHAMPAVLRAAGLQVGNRHRANGRSEYLLPYRLTGKFFTITHAAFRPVITVSTPLEANYSSLPVITKGQLKARTLSAEAFNQMHADSDPLSKRFFEAAVSLYHQRTGQAEPPKVDFTPRHPGSLDKSVHPARFVLREVLTQANAAIARFAVEHNVPLFYRRQETGGSRMESIRRNLGNTAYFSAVPGPHEALGIEPFQQCSSPYQLLPEFANMLNLAAHLDGRTYPFSQNRIEKSVDRINIILRSRELEAERARSKKFTRVRKPRIPFVSS